MEDTADKIIRTFKHADILVNNAGATLVGRFQDTSIEEFEWITGINYWGPVYSTRAFLPHLLSRSQAQIVNISSVFGIIGVHSQTGYCASKFGVRGFTESLRSDLRGTNVSVMCVQSRRDQYKHRAACPFYRP